jgi:hypothetical protein
MKEKIQNIGQQIYDLFLRFVQWRQQHIKERTFVIILALFVGVFAGSAALLLKSLIHAIANMLTSHMEISGGNYLYFIYPALKIVENVGYNLGLLYVLYPASWTIGSIVATVVLVLLFNKVKNNFAKEKFAVRPTAEQESIAEQSTQEQVSAN